MVRVLGRILLILAVMGLVEWEGAEMVGGESVVFVVRTGF